MIWVKKTKTKTKRKPSLQAEIQDKLKKEILHFLES